MMKGATCSIYKMRRQFIFRRDRGKCVYCRKPVKVRNITLDHLIPLCKGGTTVRENLVLACSACNHRKGDKMPLDFVFASNGWSL